MDPGKGRRTLIFSVIAAVVIAASAGGFLVLTRPALAAPPNLVNSWSAGSSTTVSSLAVTVATAASDTVVVTVGTKASTCTVSGVTDNAGGGSSTYARRVGPVANTVGFEIWSTAAAAAKAATQVTVSLTGGPCKVAVAVGDYSGVTSLGNTNTGTGSGANPGPVAVTVQDPSGAVVGGFGSNDGTSQTSFSGGGNLRQAPVSSGGSAATRNGDSLVDQLSQATGSRSIQTTHAAIAWAGGALELRYQVVFSTTCVDAGHPLAANQSFYLPGFTTYIRLTCTTDGVGYTSSGAIAATPSFTLPAPFTQLWSFQSSTATGTTCAGGTGAWQMTSGTAHTFPVATTTWDYCAVIPSTATVDSTSFTVAWNG